MQEYGLSHQVSTMKATVLHLQNGRANAPRVLTSLDVTGNSFPSPEKEKKKEKKNAMNCMTIYVLLVLQRSLCTEYFILRGRKQFFCMTWHSKYETMFCTNLLIVFITFFNHLKLCLLSPTSSFLFVIFVCFRFCKFHITGTFLVKKGIKFWT